MTQLFNTLFVLWLAVWQQAIAPSFAKSPKGKVIRKNDTIRARGEDTPASEEKPKASERKSANYQEALDSVLAMIPSTKQDAFVSVTKRIMSAARSLASASLIIGEELYRFAPFGGKQISEAAWKRALTFLWSEYAGVSTRTLEVWALQSTVLRDAVKGEDARIAFITVNSGRKIFEKDDNGNVTLVGHYAAAFRKFPEPDKATEEQLTDWAHEILIKSEQLEPDDKQQSAGTIANNVAKQFGRILNGSQRTGMKGSFQVALSCVLGLIKTCHDKSEPLYNSILIGLDKIEEGLDREKVSAAAHEAYLREVKAHATDEKKPVASAS